MEKEKYLVVFFKGNMISKLEFVSALVSRGISFEYTGEYIRLSESKERILLELQNCHSEEVYYNAFFAYEEVDKLDEEYIKIVSDSALTK